MDVDTIEPGLDFAEEVTRAVAACQVLVAVIGPAWLTATDGRGRRRLDHPGETLVRLEIETALTRGVRVIPVLAQGAMMPGEDDLPENLAGVHSRGLVSWCQVSAGSGGSQGFPSMAPRMASSAVTPWAAAESR